MIVINDASLLQEDFLKLLEATKILSLAELAKLGEKIKRLSGDDFEIFVYNNCREASKNSDFEGHVYQTGPHDFPDIIARKYFGIEVKMTKEDKWSSTGNSILETTRREDVEKIYMFFGKMGGDIDIKYRTYQECLRDIGVTHSPRYRIDMNLANGNSIFDKLGISYEILRNEKNPIGVIKDYYRKQLKEGEELWWIDPDVEDKVVNPIIKPFRNLSREQQEKFIAEAFILFPGIIGRSNNNKYERAAAYLIAEYNSVSSNLRDKFSAGRKVDLNINGAELKQVSSVYKRLLMNAKNINNRIQDIDLKKLETYWEKTVTRAEALRIWKNMIDTEQNYTNSRVKPSDIFEWGLR